jgi:ATP-dependent Clp endopeptidase proteolytic subunit ClpP
MTVQFKNKTANSAEIWLYDQVGADFWGEGISAKSFRSELNGLGKVSTINLRINSPGGNVFDGFAIYNALAQHPAKIVVDIDGMAASIASVIAMAGDEINIAANAMVMIHNPQGMAIGDSGEMQRTAALLDQIKGNLVDTYAKRTGANAGTVTGWMDDETWMTAEEAVDAGFADKITEEQKVFAAFEQLKRFRNVPAALGNSTAARRDIRNVLLSKQEARLRAHALAR